jgi:hypothetical protein
MDYMNSLNETDLHEILKKLPDLEDIVNNADVMKSLKGDAVEDTADNIQYMISDDED